MHHIANAALSDHSKSKLPIQKERPGSLCVLLELVTEWLDWRAGNVPENDRVDKRIHVVRKYSM